MKKIVFAIHRNSSFCSSLITLTNEYLFSSSIHTRNEITMKRFVLLAAIWHVAFATRRLKNPNKVQKAFSEQRVEPEFSHSNSEGNFRILSKSEPAMSAEFRNVEVTDENDVFVQQPGQNCGTNVIEMDTQSRSEFYRIVGGFSASNGQFPWQAFFYPCTSTWGCYGYV